MHPGRPPPRHQQQSYASHLNFSTLMKLEAHVQIAKHNKSEFRIYNKPCFLKCLTNGFYFKSAWAVSIWKIILQSPTEMGLLY